MKIEQQHINSIKKLFSEMQTKMDFVALLNTANSFLYDKETKPFKLKSLTYYANPLLCKKRYTQFTVRKKTGGERIINSPVKGLKSILKTLNFVLQCIYAPHKAATGFVLGKSVVDNAKIHVGNRFVYNIDIKDFFHSFEKKNIKYGFMIEPFNLGKKREDLAYLIASLCTHQIEIDGEIKNVLPQGSPASPTITNILCNRLDRRFSGVSKRFGAKYSRYADDITFSSPHNIYNDEAFLNEIDKTVKNENLVLNSKKTRLQKDGYRQEVTGLVVNEKVNVKRRYIKQIRMWLYYWEKYGYEKAEQIFAKDYLKDKGHIKSGEPNLAKVLSGKLEYLKMVKGDDDSTYLKLNERFEMLHEYNKTLNYILDIWEKDGIDTAMEKFESIKKNDYTPLVIKNDKDSKPASKKLLFTNTCSLSEFELKYKCEIKVNTNRNIQVTPAININIPMKISKKVDINSLSEASISLCKNEKNEEFFLIHSKGGNIIASF